VSARGRQCLAMAAWLVCLAAAPALRAEKTNFTAGVLAGICGVYDDLNALAAAGPPVVLHIDCKHPDTVREAMKKPSEGHMQYLQKVRRIYEKHSGLPYQVIHYSQLRGGELNAARIKALIITMIDHDMDQAYTDRLLEVVRATSIPTLGICGGQQIIAKAHGGKVARMRRLRSGETDPNPKYQPGWFKEWCFMPVKVLRRDPLFDGLGDAPVVREYHGFEVKQLPAEFDVLASSDECRIQTIKHKTKPVYGTQFHPEHFDAKHPDGERIVANFFAIAGLRPKAD
jgi:GMP synthase-like glutamine amidotransferase